MPKRKRPTTTTTDIQDHKQQIVEGYDDYSFYAQEDYWEKRYHNDHEKSYEWWCGVDELLPLIELLVPCKTSSILDLGCGTSGLLVGMAEQGGYDGHLTGIDFSKEAIRVSTTLAKAKDVNNVKFLCSNATKLSFSNDSMDVVLEKGTISGIISSEVGESLLKNMMKEVHRVLKDDGLFLSIMCSDPNDDDDTTNGMNVLQEMILPPLLESCKASGHYYTINVHSSDTFRGCHCYALRKKKRAMTRSATKGGTITADISVRLHEH